MTIRLDSITKDFLLVVVLLSFFAYKFPTYTKMADSNLSNLSLIQYKQREVLMLNSALESGVQLLDIKLELGSSELRRSRDLSATIKFDSFGNVPTLINLTYSIADSSGIEVYAESEEVTVETEKIITKDFKKLNLRPGKYTLTLTTLYNSNVSDEFRQKFIVKSASTVEIISWIILVLAVISVGVGILNNLKNSNQNQAV
jgi:hypothetical protein